uniref:Uncharacterized protein n=1 Tax=Vitis vinifera TaxID=29760 RepID=A5BAX5_VITVI|nr:hypothetical protein VITISV_011668 [Vitis vinifera]
MRLRRVLWNPCKEYTGTGRPDHISGIGVAPRYRHLHPDVRRQFVPSASNLHPAAATSPRMSTSEILTPDRKGKCFNFSGRTYLDHLIASTRMGEQPFCTVLQCSPEAS